MPLGPLLFSSAIDYVGAISVLIIAFIYFRWYFHALIIATPPCFSPLLCHYAIALFRCFSLTWQAIIIAAIRFRHFSCHCHIAWLLLIHIVIAAIAASHMSLFQYVCFASCIFSFRHCYFFQIAAFFSVFIAAVADIAIDTLLAHCFLFIFAGLRHFAIDFGFHCWHYVCHHRLIDLSLVIIRPRRWIDGY